MSSSGLTLVFEMRGVIEVGAAAHVVLRLLPVLLFLLAVTLLAELSDVAGVFDVAAHEAATLARGRTAVLSVLVALLATVCTVVLSLDTSAVLLTPVVHALAAQLDLDPVPFAMATVWLANTASLLLPVSNLTNLLASTGSAAAPAGSPVSCGPSRSLPSS